MGKKNKNKKKNLSIEQLKNKFKNYFDNKRNLKELVDIGKTIYSKEKTAENKENIIKSYYLRINDFLEKKMYEEAITLYDTLLNNYLDSDIEKIDKVLYIKLLLKNNKIQQVLNIYNKLHKNSKTYKEVGSLIANEMITNENFDFKKIPAGHLLIKEAKIILNSIEDIDNDNIESANIKLNKISLNSPFLDWKLFAKMYIEWKNGNLAKAIKLLDKLNNVQPFKKMFPFLTHLVKKKQEINKIPQKFNKTLLMYNSYTKDSFTKINFEEFKKAHLTDDLDEIFSTLKKLFETLTTENQKKELLYFFNILLIELHVTEKLEFECYSHYDIINFYKDISSLYLYYQQIILLNAHLYMEYTDELDIWIENASNTLKKFNKITLNTKLLSSLVYYCAAKNIFTLFLNDIAHKRYSSFEELQELINDNIFYKDQVQEVYKLIKKSITIYDNNIDAFNLFIDISKYYFKDKNKIKSVIEKAYNKFPDYENFLIQMVEYSKDNINESCNILQKAENNIFFSDELKILASKLYYEKFKMLIKNNNYEADVFYKKILKFKKFLPSVDEVSILKGIIEYETNNNPILNETLSNLKNKNNFILYHDILLDNLINTLNLSPIKYKKIYKKPKSCCVSSKEIISIMQFTKDYKNEINKSYPSNFKIIKNLIRYNFRNNDYEKNDYYDLMLFYYKNFKEFEVYNCETVLSNKALRDYPDYIPAILFDSYFMYKKKGKQHFILKTNICKKIDKIQDSEEIKNDPYLKEINNIIINEAIRFYKFKNIKHSDFNIPNFDDLEAGLDINPEALNTLLDFLNNNNVFDDEDNGFGNSGFFNNIFNNWDDDDDDFWGDDDDDDDDFWDDDDDDDEDDENVNNKNDNNCSGKPKVNVPKTKPKTNNSKKNNVPEKNTTKQDKNKKNPKQLNLFNFFGKNKDDEE